jgi:hypothetical protein
VRRIEDGVPRTVTYDRLDSAAAERVERGMGGDCRAAPARISNLIFSLPPRLFSDASPEYPGVVLQQPINGSREPCCHCPSISTCLRSTGTNVSVKREAGSFMHAIGRRFDTGLASAVQGHGVHVYYSYKADANGTHFRAKSRTSLPLGIVFSCP